MSAHAIAPTATARPFQELFGSSRPSSIHIFDTDPTDSDRSTADTIALMYHHANRAAQSEPVRKAARDIWEGCSDPSNTLELAEDTYRWVKEHVQFVEDETLLKDMFDVPHDKELLIAPDRLLTMPRPMGDCDDFSMLTHSILQRLGINSRFTTIAADEQLPWKWSHVFISADLAGVRGPETVSMDTSHGKWFGWESPKQFRRQEWRDNNPMTLKLAGLGQYDQGSGETPTEGVFTELPSSGGGSFFDSGIFADLVKGGLQIAKANFGQPVLAPGTMIQTGPQGQTIYRNASGEVYAPGILQGSSSGLGGMLPLLLIGGVVLLVLSKK